MDFCLTLADDDTLGTRNFSAVSGAPLSRDRAPDSTMSRLLPSSRSAASWGALRIFCEAVLAICASDPPSQGQSLLREILPSLSETFNRCKFREPSLREEFVAWTDGAKRLTRQATWHGIESGDQLIKRLQYIEFHATEVVDAIAALPQATTDPAAPHQHQKLPSIDNLPSDEIELANLLRFCRAIVSLASSTPQNELVVSQVFPTVHLLFQRCTPTLFARLRSELATSKSQVEGLIELAAAHCESAAEELQHEVQRTHSLAASVLDALESLYFCGNEASDGKCGIAENPAAFASDTWLPDSRETRKRTANDNARADLNFRMGVRCHRQHLLEAAEDFYLLALAHDDRHHLAQRHCGAIRLEAGRTDEAINHLTQALELQGGDAEARRWRADAFASLGRFREALHDYSWLLERSPNAFDVRLSRAVVLRELGESDQASRELEKMLRSGVRSAQLHLERGLIWEARDQRKHAIAEFRAALTLTPDYQPATQALQRLESERERGRHASKQDNGKASVTAGPANKGEPDWSEGEIAQALEEKKQSSRVASQEQQKRPSRKPDETPSSDVLAKPDLPPHRDRDPSDENTPELVGDQGAVSQQPTTQREVAVASPRLQESIDHTKKGQIAIDCPSCNRQSSMRWKQLEIGKVFVCPRCQVKLVVREGGRLAKVAQDPEGNWILETPPPFWKKDRRTTAGAVAASALMLSLLPLVAITGWRHDSATVSVQAPAGLEPRSVAFGKAWLGKDYPLIRLLTLRSQQGVLFDWLRKNRLPENTHHMQVQATIVKKDSLSAEVELKVVEPNSASLPEQPVVLHWQKEGGKWLFTPAGENVSIKHSKPKNKSGSNTIQRKRPPPQYQGVRTGPP